MGVMMEGKKFFKESGITRIGIGGHYRGKEEGAREDHQARIDEKEVEARIPIIDRAIAEGINHFDATCFNELPMLAQTLVNHKDRDSIFIASQVIGLFEGNEFNAQQAVDYFNRRLDVRLSVVPGHRFDSFAINELDNSDDPVKRKRLIEAMLKRQEEGAFRLLGFTCHNPAFARRMADAHPEFQQIILPYNFHNRAMEEAFGDYTGDAAIVCIKPLVWEIYGIPFCALNNLAGFRRQFGLEPDEHIATKAFRFILDNPLVDSFFCAINTMDELELLIAAERCVLTDDDLKELAAYDRILTADNGIPLFLAALKTDNFRVRWYGASTLSRALAMPFPDLEVNQPGAEQRLVACARELMDAARSRGYGKYIDG